MRDADWTARRFFHSGDDYFREMVNDLREARHLIRVETYIFNLDSLTEILLAEMGAAHTRGCTVQLLVDGFGSYYWLQSLTDRCRHYGIELRVWEPLPRSLGGLRRFVIPWKFKFVRVLRRLNRRDHRKVTLIDDRIAYVGSFNLTQVHSERIMGERAWRDTGARLEGESVRDLVGAFSKAWARSRRTSFRRFFARPFDGWAYDPRRSRVRLNASRKSRRFLNRDLVRRLNRTDREILLTSAYFMPTRAVLAALRKAARRGVRVEIIVPGPSDVPIVKWAAAGVSKALLKAGVRLHEFQKRVLHAKFYLIDDWATIGSTNLNHRSLFHDLEVEAVFEDPASLKELREQWEKDRASSVEMSLQSFKNRHLFRRILESIAFRLRYIL